MFTNSKLSNLEIHTHTHTPPLQQQQKNQPCIKRSDVCKKVSLFLFCGLLLEVVLKKAGRDRGKNQPPPSQPCGFNRKLDSSRVTSLQSIQVQRDTVKEKQLLFGQRRYRSKKLYLFLQLASER